MLASGVGLVVSWVAWAYLIWRAAPGVRRDLARVPWRLLRPRSPLSLLRGLRAVRAGRGGSGGLL